MKLSEIKKLQRLAKAKTDAEKSRFASVNAAQRALLAQADALAAESVKPFKSGEASGGDLVQHGRYLSHLAHAERNCRRAAAALESEKDARRKTLQRSLGEESAWEKISARAAEKRRARLEAFDEDRRGEFVLGARHAARKSSNG